MRYFTNKWIWINVITLCGWLNLSLAQTQPKFTIIPTTPTNITVSYYSTATVQYVLTNKTAITRTLTIILPNTPGLKFDTSVPGACTNPVTLASNQSCTINLSLVGSQLPSGTTSSPVKVCKTMNSNNNGADPFLCSQTSQTDDLNIHAVAIATISASPHLLILNASTGNTSYITITNTSIFTATNIRANLSGTALENNVTQDASHCQSVSPGASCRLYFTPETQAVSLTRFPIQGDNTTTISAAIRIVKTNIADISVTSGNPLILISPTDTQTLTITNNSDTVVAASVSATLTPELVLAGVTQDASDCTSIPKLETCTLSFSITGNTTPVSEQIVSISGFNTSVTQASITVEQDLGINFTLTPNSLGLQFGDTTAQSMTVSTTSTTPICNVQPNFTATALSSTVYVSNNTCLGTCISPSTTCSISYSVIPNQSVVVPSTAFPVRGDSTSTEIGYISVGINYLYVVGNTGGGLGTSKIYSYPVNPTTHLLTSTTATLALDDPTVATSPTQIVIDSENNYLYFSNLSFSGASTQDGFITRCTINSSDSTLINCETTQKDFPLPAGISLNPNGSKLYIFAGSSTANDAYYCDTSSFTSCSHKTVASASLTTSGNYGSAVNSSDSFAYFVSAFSSDTIGWCPIKTDGTFDTCSNSPNVLAGYTNYSLVITPGETFAYVTNIESNKIKQCPIDSSGAISACADSATLANITNTGMVMNALGNYLYIASSPNSIQGCTIDGTTGNLTCSNSGATIPSGVVQIYGLGLWEGQ